MHAAVYLARSHVLPPYSYIILLPYTPKGGDETTEAGEAAVVTVVEGVEVGAMAATAAVVGADGTVAATVEVVDGMVVVIGEEEGVETGVAGGVVVEAVGRIRFHLCRHRPRYKRSSSRAG